MFLLRGLLPERYGNRKSEIQAPAPGVAAPVHSVKVVYVNAEEDATRSGNSISTVVDEDGNLQSAGLR
jgi:hypothetical protein